MHAMTNYNALYSLVTYYNALHKKASIIIIIYVFYSQINVHLYLVKIPH